MSAFKTEKELKRFAKRLTILDVADVAEALGFEIVLRIADRATGEETKIQIPARRRGRKSK